MQGVCCLINLISVWTISPSLLVIFHQNWIIHSFVSIKYSPRCINDAPCWYCCSLRIYTIPPCYFTDLCDSVRDSVFVFAWFKATRKLNYLIQKFFSLFLSIHPDLFLGFPEQNFDPKIYISIWFCMVGRFTKLALTPLFFISKSKIWKNPVYIMSEQKESSNQGPKPFWSKRKYEDT